MPGLTEGTTIQATVRRVVDGDTIRVDSDILDNESLRILSLDTEESNAGSPKPVTPLGHKAKARAQEFFSQGDPVTLEFPGTDPVEVALRRYRGNFGRLLVYVYKDGVDFQETVIREGFSPYFNKYGNAVFAGHHARYVAAEREAQARHIGVWDQVGENGSEIRNYAALGTWWNLRARIIDEYRALQPTTAELLNSRLDFEEIRARAEEGGHTATVFTAVEEVKRVGSRSAVVRIGSPRQPFQLFLPNIEDEPGQGIVRLLETRYISGDDTHPRRSYAYVTGELVLFRGDPEIVVTDGGQITDSLPAA